MYTLCSGVILGCNGGAWCIPTIMHAHNHACQVNSSASMSSAIRLPRVAVQLKFTMTATEINRQADSCSDKYSACGRTHIQIVTYGCESAQKLSVTV